MGVHRLWIVQDVVLEIVQKLTEGDVARERNRNLLLAARCCKAFESPCLDLMWSRMNTIIPLLRLLPGFENHTGSIIIRGCVNQISCPRFYHYARRVQYLNFTALTMSEFGRIHLSACIRLTQIADVLLPSLRTLKIYTGESTSSQREKSLLLLSALIRSPSLHSFTLTSSEDQEGVNGEYNVGAMLTALVDLNANVQNLEISGSLSPDRIYTLGHLKAVRSLSLRLSTTTWSFEVFAMISLLRSLEVLFLDLDAAPPRLGLHRISDAFPNIRKLSLVGSIPLICQILVMISGERLESITIQRDIHDTATPSLTIELSKLFYQTFGRLFNLRTIYVDWGGERFDASYGHTPAEDMSSILYPLGQLTELESLTLKSIPPCLFISDATILTISTALPYITVLHLEQPIWPHSILPTFKSLAQLATSCPKLVKLSLTVDEARSTLPKFDNVTYHGLQDLHLLDTIIIRHVQTSSYIDKLFPNLRHIDMFHYLDRKVICDIIFNACRPARRDQLNRDLFTKNPMQSSYYD
ncbi:hypothetical protein BDZ94DRAFT_860806 [Collybia nuda]|uniref:F-box domain-containing protein n=1 Tax=Collybia nuda TaxID=64659 RepID=A0A9P6CHJ6_9AGAR|nr:hypothetical protein BDZ94DRAFT_860806 [Collybia nuda]